ncbi:MAG TPA: hypothetical protein DD416_13795 [Rhodobacteraceae bacterium]|nr:hypothetical protein [Paracoccaceae bacterium]
MMRLIKARLMYGNLFEVNSAALVERYNRALKHLTGKETKLTEFHIDISGFAPEIGDELNDDLYLNPNGCNRQFILLSTKQKTAPLLNAKFSTSREILKSFILENETQLFALTARDAVAGELVNSVYSVADPARLFNIRQVEIEADTTENHLVDAKVLLGKIDRFQTEPDAWWDDVLIADMIELAKKSGDIMRNPISLKTASFRQDNFYTEHFGGIYIFRDVPLPAAITVGDAKALGKLPIEHVLDFADRNGIAKFLADNALAESVVAASNLNAASLLRQRLDFILVDTAALRGEDLTGMDRVALRRAARQHLAELPDEFHALSDLLRYVENNGEWPRITSEHPAFFYTLRASQTKDRDLVNMLLAELSPKDVRQLFICHKEAFYRTYLTWPEAKKAFVVDFLAREYSVDKADARAALFGPEPGIEDVAPPPPPAPTVAADMIRRVGPWGAIRRNQ